MGREVSLSEHHIDGIVTIGRPRIEEIKLPIEVSNLLTERLVEIEIIKDLARFGILGQIKE